MCLEDFCESTSMRSRIVSALQRAEREGRLTVGLLPAIKKLSSMCEQALFYIMTPSRQQDSASHMQEVLLEAFCLENEIYIIKLDSSETLREILPDSKIRDYSCALIQLPYSNVFNNRILKFDTGQLSPPERLLVEYCENNFGSFAVPIIKLPEK